VYEYYKIEKRELASSAVSVCFESCQLRLCQIVEFVYSWESYRKK